MTLTRRRLPHIYPEGTPLFLTWHLHGSVPLHLAQPPGSLTSGEAFVWMDRHLDRAKYGPKFLAREDIARVFFESLWKGEELRHYDVFAYVLMANHVHLLIRPLIAPSKLLQSLKRVTARDANRILGRTGEPFWQKESYDHWVRNDAEFQRIVAYIENNPVKAGLVKSPEDYPWSSAVAHGLTVRCRDFLDTCS